MTKTRGFALFIILFSLGISILWGCSLARKVPGGPMDFQDVYLGSKTLLQHHNPYSVAEMEKVYISLGGDSIHFPNPYYYHQLLVLFVNLPTTLLVVAPLTLLPLGTAQVLWLVLESSSLALAAFLMWNLGAKRAPALSACFAAFVLANCEAVLGGGNTAAVVVGLSVIAAWCFLKDRLIEVGIVCMALGLAIKPHDSGFVWLFFLLAGGRFRKRALQSAVLTACLVIPALLWVSHVAPTWFHDWQSNVAVLSAPGALNDPRPTAVSANSSAVIIGLQAIFSGFIPDPRLFNLASCLACAPLLLVWAVTLLRSRIDLEQSFFALAAVVPITLLITYHRIYDAKLLLLTIPACAVLWASPGSIRWVALAANSIAMLFGCDVPITSIHILVEKLHLSTATFSDRLIYVFMINPTQVVLFALSAFYLWIFVRRSRAYRATEQEAIEREPEDVRCLAETHA